MARFLVFGGLTRPLALVSVLVALLVIHPSPPLAQAGAEVYTVNTTDDFDDDACNQVHCSLREAVEYANNNVGADDIEFAIPDTDPECNAGVCTIQLAFSLDLLDAGTTIDGYTQPGASPNTNAFGQPLNTDIRIQLEGNNTADAAFVIEAPNITVRGLSIIRFAAQGIRLEAGSNETHIVGNFIGVGPAGLAPTGVVPAGDAPEGNFQGISYAYTTVAPSLVIGGPDPQDRNLISGNSGGGISVGPGSGLLIENNYIGTDYTGSAPLGNLHGIRIFNESQNHLVRHNIIAYNQQFGVVVTGGFGDANGNTISENSIHSNVLSGISLQSGGNDGIPPPVITGTGSASGTACPGCTVEVFSDDVNEGRIFEGSTTTNGAGNWSFPDSLTGPFVTATATDSSGNTSQFSNPFPLIIATPTPSPSPSPTATATPTPTPTPTPTSTPTPTTTPTPSGTTPAPETLIWGDNNCADGPNPVDGLLALRFDAGLDTNTGICPDMGQQVNVLDASIHRWGDVDCNETIDPVDGLKLLRFDAGLSVQQEPGCPEIGEEVSVAS